MRSAAGRLGILTVLALVCFGSAPAAAQQEHLEPAGEHEGTSEEHGKEHFHKNHIALFVGSTQAELEHGERDDPQFTLGFDYERRLTTVFGIGALLDFVVEGNREGIVGIPVFLHAGNLTFQVAVGGERIRDTGDWEAIGRLGALYEFVVGRKTLSPGLFYDITAEGGTWVVGLNIGKGW